MYVGNFITIKKETEQKYRFSSKGYTFRFCKNTAKVWKGGRDF